MAVDTVDAVDQDSLFIVGVALWNHSVDQPEALPRVDPIPTEVSMPAAGALDSGYFSAANAKGLKARDQIYIAIERETHCWN